MTKRIRVDGLARFADQEVDVIQAARCGQQSKFQRALAVGYAEEVHARVECTKGIDEVVPGSRVTSVPGACVSGGAGALGVRPRG